MKTEQRTNLLARGIDRRSFLKISSALTAGTALAGSFFRVNAAAAVNFGNPILIDTDPRVDVKYSVCLQCHSACGIKARVVDGILTRLEGNPYHPNTMEPHLPYATDPAEAKGVSGKLCAKGQAGIQTIYNPLRIKQPLKRTGARGAGQWEAISWEQAFQEIGDRLKALRDLDNPIDPDAPELGPRVNRVLFTGGRNEHGQKEYTDRFWGNSFGTTNKRHDHTSICEASQHVAYEIAMGNKDFGVGPKDKASTDLANCEFVMWFGSDPMAANFPFVAQCRKATDLLTRGGKLAIVDPRCNVAASKADWWLPVIPGTDAALALAMGRWILDNQKHNVAFLERPHDGAANPTGEQNTTDATFLVKIVEGHEAGFLRADEAGIEGGASDQFVVWVNGAAAAYDTVDAAELLPGGVTVNGIQCKTAFQIYADEARRHTLAEWAQICGIPESTIVEVAQELTAHGRKASVEHYRGPAKHTNGTYSGWCIISLNTLIGNYNWVGGHVFGGGHWHETGGKSGQVFSPKTVMGGVSPSGIQYTRVKAHYEDSAEFAKNSYPAKRPWFPFANHFNYQEVIPSIEDEYPYKLDALILYWNDTAYSTPGAKAAVQRVLGDEEKLPLIVAIDIEMGETSAYADYLLPDTTYLERWSTPHVGTAILTKTSGIRQPVVGSFDGQMNYTPFLPETKMMEDILIGLGKAMGLTMDWKDADGSAKPLERAWDYHHQLVQNIADEAPAVPGATPEERRQYVLGRGGRFEAYENGWNGDVLTHKFTGRIYFFNEGLAKSKDSMTGEWFKGYPHHEEEMDALSVPIAGLDPDLPLTLVTYKQAWHSMARTICQPWLVSVQPENFVELNAEDAATRSIRTGDQVRVRSASLPEGATGLAQVTQTLRPGIVAVAHSFGHWEMSSKSYQVNGGASGHDASRSAGVAGNPIMRLDPKLKNVALQDKVGGSVASYFNTRVEVEKL